MKMEVVSSVACEASHSKSTVCARYNSDGTLLATTGSDRRVIIHRVEDGVPEKIVEGNHTAGVSQVFWLSDRYLGAASDDGMIKIRDIEEDKNVRTFQLSRQRCPSSVDVNPINHTIVVGDTAGSVSMFHVNHASPFSPFEAQGKGVVSVQFNQSGEEMLTAGQDGIIRQWVMYEKPVCVASLIPCPKLFTTISCASYSENNKYILTSTLDSTHRLFRVMDHKQATSGFMKDSPLERQFIEHVNTRFMTSSMLAFHEDRGYVISGSDDGKLHVWDADSEDLILSTQAHSGPLFSLHRNPRHDRLEVASCGGDGQVKIWTLSPTSSNSTGLNNLSSGQGDNNDEDAMMVDESS